MRKVLRPLRKGEGLRGLKVYEEGALECRGARRLKPDEVGRPGSDLSGGQDCSRPPVHDDKVGLAPARGYDCDLWAAVGCILAVHPHGDMVAPQLAGEALGPHHPAV